MAAKDWHYVAYRLSRKSADKLIEERLKRNRVSQSHGFYKDGLPTYKVKMNAADVGGKTRQVYEVWVYA